MRCRPALVAVSVTLIGVACGDDSTGSQGPPPRPSITATESPTIPPTDGESATPQGSDQEQVEGLIHACAPIGREMTAWASRFRSASLTDAGTLADFLSQNAAKVDRLLRRVPRLPESRKVHDAGNRFVAVERRFVESIPAILSNRPAWEASYARALGASIRLSQECLAVGMP